MVITVYLQKNYGLRITFHDYLCAMEILTDNSYHSHENELKIKSGPISN
jgi:hypothetical protein